LRAICFTSGGWNSICVAVEHGGRRRRTLRVLHIRACLATSCQAELGTKVASERERRPIYAAARPGEVYRIALSPSQAKQWLGWAPQTSLVDGLRRTVEWFRG